MVPVCEGVLVTQTALPITLIAAALSTDTDSQGQGQELQEKAVHQETQSCSSVHKPLYKDKNE